MRNEDCGRGEKKKMISEDGVTYLVGGEEDTTRIKSYKLCMVGKKNNLDKGE